LSKRRTQFGESAFMNNATFRQYVERLEELSLSMFEWSGLPDTVDARFLELCLFLGGKSVFFKDEAIGFLSLKCIANGPFDVYGIPIKRKAYASNNSYQKNLNNKNSVIIWNNYLHTNSYPAVLNYAKRLYELDRIIDVNAKAQKTPVLITAPETQRQVMLNVYKEYDGNSPVIFGDKQLDTKGIQAINTGAPYVADKIYELKTQIWNEALTYLGISNINIQKKERMITDEVMRNQGGTMASRYSRLEARRMACEEINNMFGLNIWCDYRDDVELTDEDEMVEEMTGEEQKEGDSNE
jgi:hypothetical protein